MLNMSKKNGASPSREGTGSAIREASRSGATPAPATDARPRRRSFSAEFKRRIVKEADAALASGQDGAVGELLRREGLYSSHLTEWRRQRDAGELAGLTPRKRGRKSRKSPLVDELAKLQRENERLQQELAKANTVIDVQRKVAALLGGALPEPTEEELAEARGRFRSDRLDIKPGRRR